MKLQELLEAHEMVVKRLSEADAEKVAADHVHFLTPVMEHLAKLDEVKYDEHYSLETWHGELLVLLDYKY